MLLRGGCWLPRRETMRLLSGSLALQALGLNPSTDHLDSWYPLDTASSLRTWLTDQAMRWEADDPCFAAQCAVGLAELSAGPTYLSLVQSCEITAKKYQAAPGRSAVEDATRMLAGGDKAVAGLRAFVDGASDADDELVRAKRARAALKLEACGESEADRRQAVAAAHDACAEWQALQAAESHLSAAREAIGLPELERTAKSLERQRGKEASKGGKQFETAAGEPLLEELLRSFGGGEASGGEAAGGVVSGGLASGGEASGGVAFEGVASEGEASGGEASDGTELVALQSVTLGMAKAEIDYLFCRPREASGQLQEAGGSTAAGKRERPVVLEPSLQRKRRGGQRLPAGVFVDAVAMCEVKRDSSDVGKAVAKSAEVMAWLSGERGGYDPAEWTNRNYPCGHFGLDADGTTERVHACTSGGVTYLFDRRSFANFCGGAGGHSGQPTLPHRLHIVTSTRRRAGYDTVRPVCSRVFGRMQHKASRDIELLGALRSHDAAEQYDWEALRLWLREGTASLSAVGALRLFAADAAAVERLHVEVYDEQADDE